MRITIQDQCPHGKYLGHWDPPKEPACLSPQEHDWCDGGKKEVIHPDLYIGPFDPDFVICDDNAELWVRAGYFAQQAAQGRSSL